MAFRDDDGSSYVIYERLSTPRFLAFALLPAATVITAGVHDDPERVVSELPEHCSSFLFHLNCTVTSGFPRERARLVDLLRRSGREVLNAGVTDISKHAVQDRCIRLGLPSTRAVKEGADDELLMVKTNLNYGGEKERALSMDERRSLGLAELPGHVANALDYRVLSRRAVDADMWLDQTLVRERYITNSRHVWYRAYCFRTRMVLSEMVNPEQVKKVGGSEMTRQWRLDRARASDPATGDASIDAIVRTLRLFCDDAALDFGCVDVLVDDAGTPYVIDVNSTPAYFQPVPHVLEHLAAGRH